MAKEKLKCNATKEEKKFIKLLNQTVIALYEARLENMGAVVDLPIVDLCNYFNLNGKENYGKSKYS
jgi:hypothetical protein